MTLSLKKVSITSEDSPKLEEHDWESYLIGTNSEAAPACNFKQSLLPPKNEFNVGEKLESIDPRNEDSWCIGTIIAKVGPRIRIRLDGTDDRNDFWRLVDSADIRPFGTTKSLGENIVPPLGFQQNSTRWTKYFDKHVQNGPFADPSSFKSQPTKPEKNLFEKGQKLEAVDPRHPELISPATIDNLISGDSRITLSLDGWSSSNNFKIDYSSRDIFPVGWCKSAGIRIAKIGGHSPSRASNRPLATTPNGKRRQQRSKTPKKTVSSLSNHSSTAKNEKNSNTKKLPPIKIESDESSIHDVKKQPPIVTVYWNYVGDNCGMLLNSQRFYSSMPSIFGPGECNSVLKTIFDCCTKCSFQPTLFINRIRDLFSFSDGKKKRSTTSIQLENGTLVNIPLIDNGDEFWEIIRVFQNGILAGIDLFVSTPPTTINQDKKGYSSLFNQSSKRKSIEFDSENKIFLNNGKASRSSADEESVYDTESSFNHSKLTKTSSNNSVNISSNGPFRPLERFTPSDVATFVRRIDPSFHSLASRFLQEEIDGKALLLLTTDTLMRHLGLKLGPSLKIIDHIEKFKNKESF